MKNRFLEDMKEKITSARRAYTKVTEEKVKYRFGHNEIEHNNLQIFNISLFAEEKGTDKPSTLNDDSQFDPMTSQIRLVNPRSKAKGTVQISEKHYDFKNIAEFVYFNKESRKEDKTKQLRLRDIDQLDTEEEFQRNYQDYQLSFEIMQLFQ